jgi:hypothetical protein
MKLKEYVCQDANFHQLNVLKELETKQTDVVILRNFLSTLEIQQLLSVSNSVESYYEVYDGYNAFPRPFDHIPRNPITDYQEECQRYLKTIEKNRVAEHFQEKLKTISKDFELLFNTREKEINHSGTWSSFRRLALGKGYFEVHCGRLFQDWNKAYFEKFTQKADIDTQFAFLIILQRPITPCDIEIFDLTWDEAAVKIDTNHLQKKNGEILSLDKIRSEKVELFEGDLLLFDEGNYWHLVPPFTGENQRVSFGGFMTKLRNGHQYLVWS